MNDSQRVRQTEASNMDNSFDIKLSKFSKETRKVLVQDLNQASVTCKISRFRHHACDPGYIIIESQGFRCSDATWTMSVDPKGGSFPGVVFVYLKKVGPTTKKLEHAVSAKFTVPCNGGPDYTYEVEKYHFKGVDTLCLQMIHTEKVIRENSGYLENGIFTIKCDMTVFGEEKELLEDETPKQLLPGYISNSLCSDFEGLYKKGQFSDVTLKSEGEEFAAHRCVLGARSRVFEAMFEHDTREKLEGAADLVQMKAGTVRDMLRYIYCGRIRDLSAEEALDLYVAADRYDLADLRAFCREVILLDISVENVCDITEVAYLHDDEALISKLKTFLVKSGKELIKTEKWKAICTDKPILCGKMFEWAFSE